MEKILEFVQNLPIKTDHLPKPEISQIHFTREFLIGSGFGFLIFILYLELNPKLGNIWYRISSNGNKTINLTSLTNHLKEPLKNKEFWRPKNWDINFITFSALSGLTYYGIQKLLNFKDSFSN